jgi:hypothetical protein
MKTLTAREQLIIIVKLCDQSGYDRLIEKLLSIEPRDQDKIFGELVENLKLIELGVVMSNDLNCVCDMLEDVVNYKDGTNIA